MKHNLIFHIFSTALACVTLCVGLTACQDGNGEEQETQNNKRDNPYLLLANKEDALGASYEPDSLTQLDTDLTVGGKHIELESTAAEAVEDLIEAVHKAGYRDIAVTSGYRTYAYQKSLFQRYMDKERSKPANADKTEAEIEAIVLTYSAKPGTSEHQTGLCVDLFDVRQMRELENYGHEGSYPDDVGFAETQAYTWLVSNAHRYGFILRYPEDKTSITGYQYESWHYRYVGVEVATEMWEQDLTLEEYLAAD